MELVERLRSSIYRLEALSAEYVGEDVCDVAIDAANVGTEAADLLEEALNALKEARFYVARYTAASDRISQHHPSDFENHQHLAAIDAILTKSQGEKIDG